MFLIVIDYDEDGKVLKMDNKKNESDTKDKVELLVKSGYSKAFYCDYPDGNSDFWKVDNGTCLIDKVAETYFHWELVREERDNMLKNSAWRFATDSPNSPEWLVYRKSLQRVMEQPNPFNIVWPKQPE